jgi:phosphoribosylglycinamide formyltransferase-1
MATTKLRLAVLASGGGTNLQAIIDHCRNNSLDAEIVLVISNNPDAGALKRAERAGIPQRCIDHRDFSGRQEFDRAILTALRDADAELIVLAGFMRLISDVFLEAFPERIINIHPALLPAFPGLHVHKKAIEYGARFSGCTVHFVDNGIDTGPIITQAVVPVLPDDDEDTLANRILKQEHRIYPQAIQWLAEKRVKIENHRVRILDAAPAEGSLLNPVPEIS